DEEVAELEKAIEDAEEALENAQDKVDALPEGDAKDDIQGELDEEKGKLEDIDVPASNEEAFNEAEQAVEDAAKAVDEAEQALEDALADGKITDDVIDELEEAVNDANKALDDAQELVDELPDGSAKDAIQDSLNGEKDRLEDVEVPENNEDAFNEAEQAVADAEQAVKDAEEAIEEAIAGGKITDDEAEALEKAVDDANQAVADAQEKVNALPDGTSKDAIQNNLDGVAEDAEALDAPTSNEAAFDEAEEAVEAAEQAVADAEDALADAIADNNVTAEEVEALEGLRDAAEEALNNANEKVTALPDGDDKSDLKGRLDELENITVPEEGTYDQDLAAAADLLADAKAAIDAAEQKLADAQEDGKITEEEVTELEAAKQAAQDKLDAANTAIGELPDGGAKDALVGEAADEQTRLDNITVPAVDEGAFEDAADLLADAKAAVDNAEQKLADAIADGKVEQSEIDALEDAITNAQAELDRKRAAYGALPPGSAKEDLVTELVSEQQRLDDIEVHAVDEGAFEDAADLLADAKAAVDNAEQKLADAIADGKVEQSEIDALEDAITNAQAELDAAEAAINDLPEGSAKDDLVAELGSEQQRLDDIEVPEVDEGAFADAADLLADAKAATDMAELNLAAEIDDGKDQ